MKKFLMLVLPIMLATTSHAASSVSEAQAEYELNRASPNAMARNLLGTLSVKRQVRSIQLSYDVATQTASSAASVFMVDANGRTSILPGGSIIRNCIIDVITAPSSASVQTGNATIAIGTGLSDHDLKTAAFASAYTGLMACIPVGTAATSIKLSNDSNPVIKIGPNNLTAGKFNVFIDYVLAR